MAQLKLMISEKKQTLTGTCTNHLRIHGITKVAYYTVNFWDFDGYAQTTNSFDKSLYQIFVKCGYSRKSPKSTAQKVLKMF